MPEQKPWEIQYEKTSGTETPLSSNEETQFQVWKQKYAPHDSGADYDLRGAFKSGLKPDPTTGHWPDTFKKPNHPTFSVESQYAVGNNAAKAGRWTGPNHDVFVPAATGILPWEQKYDQPTDRTTMDALIEQRFPKAQYPEIPEGEMSRIEKLQAIQAARYPTDAEKQGRASSRSGFDIALDQMDAGASALPELITGIPSMLSSGMSKAWDLAKNPSMLGPIAANELTSMARPAITTIKGAISGANVPLGVGGLSVKLPEFPEGNPDSPRWPQAAKGAEANLAMTVLAEGAGMVAKPLARAGLRSVTTAEKLATAAEANRSAMAAAPTTARTLGGAMADTAVSRTTGVPSGIVSAARRGIGNAFRRPVAAMQEGLSRFIADPGSWDSMTKGQQDAYMESIYRKAREAELNATSSPEPTGMTPNKPPVNAENEAWLQEQRAQRFAEPNWPQGMIIGADGKPQLNAVPSVSSVGDRPLGSTTETASGNVQRFRADQGNRPPTFQGEPTPFEDTPQVQADNPSGSIGSRDNAAWLDEQRRQNVPEMDAYPDLELKPEAQPKSPLQADIQIQQQTPQAQAPNLKAIEQSLHGEKLSKSALQSGTALLDSTGVPTKYAFELLDAVPDLQPGPKMGQQLAQAQESAWQAIQTEEGLIGSDTPVSLEPALTRFKELATEASQAGERTTALRFARILKDWSKLGTEIPWEQFRDLKRSFMKDAGKASKGTLLSYAMNDAYKSLMDISNSLSEELTNANKRWSTIKKALDSGKFSSKTLGRRAGDLTPNPSPLGPEGSIQTLANGRKVRVIFNSEGKPIGLKDVESGTIIRGSHSQ